VDQDEQTSDYEERIRASFAKQGLMATLEATLGQVSPGVVEIELRPHAGISQQHGFVHAGAVSAIADSAAGYAALSLMPAGREVLTTEYKINLLAPALGDRIVARAGCEGRPHTHSCSNRSVRRERRGGKADRASDSDTDDRRRAGRNQRLM
jgi:uncharacterized protein (TIGR00369 family)